MFLPTDNSKKSSNLPRNCSLNESDWNILASMWHPVSFAKDIGHKPVAAKLLDVPLVIYRTKECITVAKDLCMHRGTPLSKGWIENDMIICPMHGLHFDAAGKCCKIPSVTDPNRPISDRLKLNTYKSVERYGLVWVCLNGEPRLPLPEWPLLEDAALISDSKIHKIEINEIWPVSAARHIENFNDSAHLSWVHADSFGNREEPGVHDIEIDQSVEHVLKRDREYIEKDGRLSKFVAELTIPFSSVLVEQGDEGELFFLVADAACPVSANETRVFQIIWSGLPASNPKTHAALWKQVNQEDVELVSLQCPEEIPLDVREEIHVPADQVSLKYRQTLKKMGLGAPQFTS